jgi:hypothetical protein
MAVADRARDFWDRISPRERKLVVLLAIAVPITLALWFGFSIKKGLDERGERVDQMRRAVTILDQLRRNGPPVSPQDDPLKDIGTEPLSLDTYLDNAAKKAGLTIKSILFPRRSRRGIPCRA